MAGICKSSELVAEYKLTVEDLQVKVTPGMLVHISTVMNNWKVIAPHLELKPTEREDIEAKGTPEEQRLLMLERRAEKFGRQASFFKLIESFLKVGRRDLAEQVCEYFQENAWYSKCLYFDYKM